MQSTKDKGDAGEQIACTYLRKNGYTILETKWRFRKKEVDIIARKEETVVFVEVKSRINAVFGEPEESVNRRKQSFLVSAAHHYLEMRDLALEGRFDVIAITGDPGCYDLRHFEDAFRAVAK